MTGDPPQRSRARRLLPLLMILATPVLLAGVVLSLAWFRPTSDRANSPISLDDRLGYPAHVLVGTVFARLGAPPDAVATQWLKAAAHADSEAEIDRAARGLAAAAERSQEVERLKSSLCRIVADGQMSRQFDAVQRAGLGCNADQYVLTHVPEGTEIHYRTRPPNAGAHYSTLVSRYGVHETPILPGYWVHNLEHGAIVLLYNCPEGCPALVAQLQDFFASLPPNHNAPNGGARFLAIPYTDMDHRLAVVAWWRLLTLDEFDDFSVRDFYEKHVDRGPECRDLRCPA